MLLLSIFLKPFVAVVVLVPTLMLCRWLYRRIPDSRLKRVLFSPLPGHQPRDWR
jgi:hypothetical protein